MKKTYIIIVTGPEASGKTEISNKIGNKFNFPVFSKDDFKHIMFNCIGIKDQKTSDKYGKATFEIIDYIIKRNVIAENNIVVEANFNPKIANKKFDQLKKEYDFIPIIIELSADGNILYKRFKKRVIEGKRHPGHLDDKRLPFFKEKLAKGKYIPLKIKDSHKIKIDSTDFKKINYDKIFNNITKIIFE